MRYAVSHITTMQYATPVHLARFNVRLQPAEWPGQRVRDHVLTIEPIPVSYTEGMGAYHVRESRFTLGEPVRTLQVESRFTVERDPLPAIYETAEGPRLTALRESAMGLPDLGPLGPASYIFASPIATPERDIALWAGALLAGDMPIMAAGRALMRAIHEGFAFESGATYPDTPPIEAFRQRRGVCQDFSHVMIVAARAHGIPAAYVSGYLRTDPPPGQARLVGADAMHAWVNLWCGHELGWVGFDPTNDTLAGSDHIFVGMGRDYSDVAPLDGTFRGGAQQTMFYAVDVAPLQ